MLRPFSAMARGACCGLGSLLLAVAPLACYLHIEAPELVVDGESWLRDRASHSARRSCDAVVVLHRKADPVGTESWEIATLIAGSFFGEINAKVEMRLGTCQTRVRWQVHARQPLRSVRR